jgi:hypothetical protein
MSAPSFADAKAVESPCQKQHGRRQQSRVALQRNTTFRPHRDHSLIRQPGFVQSVIFISRMWLPGTVNEKQIGPLKPGPPTSASSVVMSPEVTCCLMSRTTCTPMNSRFDHSRIASRSMKTRPQSLTDPSCSKQLTKPLVSLALAAATARTTDRRDASGAPSMLWTGDDPAHASQVLRSDRNSRRWRLSEVGREGRWKVTGPRVGVRRSVLALSLFGHYCITTRSKNEGLFRREQTRSPPAWQGGGRLCGCSPLTPMFFRPIAHPGTTSPTNQGRAKTAWMMSALFILVAPLPR